MRLKYLKQTSLPKPFIDKMLSEINRRLCRLSRIGKLFQESTR